MVFASFAEVLSIGAVLPFLGVLMEPRRVFVSPLMQPIINLLGITDATQLLTPLTTLFILTAIFSGTMRLVLLWFQTRLSFAIGADFSVQIYRNTLYQPYAVHLSRNSSEVITGVLTKTNSVVHHTLLPALVIVSSGLILLAIMIALVCIDPVAALIAFGGFGTVYVLIVLATKKRLTEDGVRISRESKHVIKALQEGLGGIRDVLIDGTQAAYCKIYHDADLPLRKSQANIQIIGGAPRFLIEAFGMVLIATLAYGLVERGGGVAEAVPLLGALAIGAQRLLPVMQSIYFSASHIRGHQSSLADVLNLLDQPLPKYANEPCLIPLEFNKSIRLEQVNFRYKGNGPWVLQGINLEIPKGSRVGIIGATGSGKSTLIDLIMGLINPNEGKLIIDHITLNEKNCRGWQEQIAHVPQTIFLADATVAENIAFGVHPDLVDYARVKEAARQAQIAETIESWTKKYETIVGERGVRLSGGQRQRIGIARALYKKAKVIILDEATSALDNVTECEVIEAIQNIGDEITLVTVAHRLTTLKHCDQIFELEFGQVKRTCSYVDI